MQVQSGSTSTDMDASNNHGEQQQKEQMCKLLVP